MEGHQQFSPLTFPQLCGSSAPSCGIQVKSDSRAWAHQEQQGRGQGSGNVDFYWALVGQAFFFAYNMSLILAKPLWGLVYCHLPHFANEKQAQKDYFP